MALLMVGGRTNIPEFLTLAFGTLFTLSPLCVPVADWWAVRNQRGRVPAPN